MEQYERHQMMGKTLAHRLGKKFHFGMVVKDERDPRFTQIKVPYVRWSELKERLAETGGSCYEPL
jgi:hypothetical protein